MPVYIKVWLYGYSINIQIVRYGICSAIEAHRIKINREARPIGAGDANKFPCNFSIEIRNPAAHGFTKITHLCLLNFTSF